MPDMEKLRAILERNDFATSYFETAREAADYLDGKLDGKTIGVGGAMTIKEMGLGERLGCHNKVISHFLFDDPVEAAQAAQVYLTSCNALAETGEILNIDGTGNRVAATLFGHEEVYIILGVNKVAPDYDSALWRARNIASPKNAQRLGRKTPCAAKADKCYNCNSPERICRALVTLWQKPRGIGRMEVVIINEPLGF